MISFSFHPTRRKTRFGLGFAAFFASAALAQSTDRLKAIELVKEAALDFGRGEMGLVIKICRQALILDPTYPRAYTYLGAAYQRRGDRATACNAFNRVLKLAPGSPDAARASRGIKELGCGASPSFAPLRLQLEGRWSARSGIVALSFASNETQLSSGALDGAWRLWRLPDGRLDRLEIGNGFEAGAAASSPNFYAIGMGDGKVRLFDAEQGRQAGQIEARSGLVSGLSYSRDGRFLAVAGADGALKIYDGLSNLLLRQVPGDGFLLSGVAFSPDARFFAAGVGSVVRVYETNSGRLLRSLPGDGLPVSAIAWSRGGTLLSGAIGYKIRVWNAENGQLLRTLSGHRLAVSALAFGNGSTLASGGYDGQLRLWNAQSGANLGAFAFHGGQIRGLAFNASGKRLASGDANGLIGLWRLP